MLAQSLRQIRMMRGLTQRQVAEKLGVDRSTYSYYEIGKSNVDVSTLLKIAKIFRVSYKDLLKDEEDGISVADIKEENKIYQTLSDEEKNLIAMFRELKPLEQQRVISNMKRIIER